MNDERRDFSRRLAEALQAKGYAPRPGVLHKLFNSHYTGRSVAFSTASKWLRGSALPAQDKLVVLADVLGVDPQVLRFGSRSRVGERPGDWHATTTPDEHRLLLDYRGLAEPRRRLVRALVEALASGKSP